MRVAIVAAMSLSVEEKADWLGRVQLFGGVDQTGLEQIAARCGEVEFPAGYTIVLQGQIGNGLYIVVKGTARVMRGSDELATLGPGDFFGELAVIDQMPRMASVVAGDPVTCLALASWDLIRLLEQEPTITLNLLRELAARLRALSQQHHH
jgi:CRP/FNR family transcriptional regulator, cyclic AMP receptor protein